MELNDYGPISQAHNKHEGTGTTGKYVIVIALALLVGASLSYVYMKSMQNKQRNKDLLTD